MARHPEVVTLGCRLNTYESEVIRELARDADDLVIVNTCAVTGEAERQARQAIRRARRERPGARIVVTGCAAQVAPERFAAMPEVDHVVGNLEKMKPATWSADADRPRVQVGDIARARRVDAPLLASFSSRTRAFVQIQNGCDHDCTFCIIPSGRGPSRSVPPERIVAQVSRLVESGVAEVVFCGVDLTAYGGDLAPRSSLGALVRLVLDHVPGVARLRLSSIDPVEIDTELWRALAEEPRLMPHLHLSMQAGDDVVLKRMKRRHRQDDVREVVHRARQLRPEIVFGADVIAGFPTETDAMFERTRAAVEELDFVHLHVFPYSPRPGTPAARMPQVPVRVRKERAARLRAQGDDALRRWLERKVGGAEEVLVERGGLGHTRDFARARAEGAAPGSLVWVRIERTQDDVLIGRPMGRGGHPDRREEHRRATRWDPAGTRTGVGEHARR